MATITSVILYVVVCFWSSEISAAGSHSDNLNVLAVLKDVSHALECMGDIQKDSVQLQRESLMNQKISEESLAALDKLPELVEECYEVNKALKDQLAIEVSKVQDLENNLMATKNENEQNKIKVQDLESNLMATKNENEQNKIKVQDLESNLLATKKENEQNKIKVQDIEKKLNQSLETIKQFKARKAICDKQEDRCSLPGEDKIRKQVKEYNSTKDWRSLYLFLEKELSHDSAAYQELQLLAYDNRTPLNNIGYKGLAELAKVLVNCGGATNVTDNYFTMLHGAAISGTLTVMQPLLCHGENTEIMSHDKWTPLMYAAAYRGVEVVKYLVQAGASTTTRDSQGRTAFDVATTVRNTAVTEYLSQLPH